ncbi:phosphate transport system regulatory protein [Salmonella enterica subsp. enterica]|uniref:Phosphate-specific transport system accessory protein PhoU n=1 Tax=Salmonella enterica I TaxID=59201 RepID=A0A379WJ16_SALET|nr:phosphate transport system regulatory protein [Salmonella enterica subsp. enterica]
MDSLNLNKHISGQFNAELESIRTQVMTMGGMVEQQLSDAITAMHNQDSELAKRVVEGDHQVNMMEVAIDEACVRIIAKRQPTASDLRLVMAIIKPSPNWSALATWRIKSAVLRWRNSPSSTSRCW